MWSCNLLKFWMFMILGGLMTILSGGCAPSGSRLVYPEVDVKMIIRDAVTGETINGCLLVMEIYTSPWVIERLGPVHGAAGAAGIVDSVTIERVDSGDRLRQKAVYDEFIPLGLFSWKAKYTNWGLSLYKTGYISKGSGVTAAVESMEAGKPMVITMTPESPGVYDSDLSIVSLTELTLEKEIPHLKKDDPLRRELLVLLAGQLERIIRTPPRDPQNYYLSWKDDAKKCLAKIKKLLAEQK